jgi:hypothetical protein
MRLLLLLSLYFFARCPLASQTIPLCGQELVCQLFKTHYPAFHQAATSAFEAAGTLRASSRNKLTVPVVVHVVWKQAPENLADSLIEAQIRVLNEDFNRTNPDATNTRPIFQPVAGEAGIEFVLEAVKRVQTTQDFKVDPITGSLASEVKFTALGGSDAVDPNHHLNIWVCKIQPITLFGITLGQILGFAFPPANLDNWPAQSGAPQPGEDGVVIDFRMFGPNNPNPIQAPGSTENLIVKGRTPTHEVGHYLGLRHIWGDGGLLGPNNCNQSDGVADTPFANAQSEFDCDFSRNTCPAVEPFFGVDMPDMVENFMDYSSESCMNLFSKGQVERMRAVLEGPRSGLTTGPLTAGPLHDAASLQISPNPVGQVLHVVQTAADESLLAIINLNGQTVWQAASEGQPSRTVDISHLLPGMYFFQARSPRKWQTVRFIKM